jgi:hypothetical protein
VVFDVNAHRFDADWANGKHAAASLLMTLV